MAPVQVSKGPVIIIKFSRRLTVSNPITTLAGSDNLFSMNVITTESMVYKVLLPLDNFAPKSLAPAPSPPKPKKDEGADTPVVPKDISSAESCIILILLSSLELA
ncbi:hypothetical protein SADUNF_Sadunf15G0012400 [Salix dunnii]|uniref:Uncharacterized protein n=1 Tax=Salix dunnii TaxID=1413687 RepID=A0A835J9Y8_9ROSI|nr:hypothetical protein SADUNF_Sadunf15G0012400 [Salix dunnii]